MSDREKQNFAKGTLKSKAARGGVATIASELLRGAIRVASVAVLARLLTPEDFGVVAVVTGYVMVLEAFSEGGLSAASLRERTLSSQQSSNLFWCNVAIAILMGGVAISGAPLLAHFVGDPDVTRFVPMATLAMVLRSLGSQQGVLLQRRLNFMGIARAEVAELGTNAAVAIGLALAGFGIWSIFIANAISAAVVTSMRWMMVDWRPGPFRKGHGTRRLIHHGSGLLIAATINSIRMASDGVILARFVGTAEVGQYSKAYGLLVLPLGRILRPMNRLALPVLVQLWHDPERFRKAYYRLVSFLELITTPVTAFLFMGAEEVVLIMLGEQFAPAVPIFRILALASLGMATTASAAWVQQASGRVKRQIGLSAWTASVVISANVTGAWLGGAKGMAIGWVIGGQLSRLPACYYSLHGSPIPFGTFLQAMIPGTILALAGVAAMSVPRFVIEVPGGPAARLATIWAVGLAAMAATALAWPRLRRDIHAVIDMVRAARKSPRPKRAEEALSAGDPGDLGGAG